MLLVLEDVRHLFLFMSFWNGYGAHSLLAVLWGGFCGSQRLCPFALQPLGVVGSAPSFLVGKGVCASSQRAACEVRAPS